MIVRVSRPVEHAERDYPVTTVPTLGELARLAIDVETAVLEELSRDRYVVEHERTVYVYEPPADPRQDREHTYQHHDE